MQKINRDFVITIFDGNRAPGKISLSSFHKEHIYFGRDSHNDIVLTSPLVSMQHGRFTWLNGSWIIEDKGAYDNAPSTNGLSYNNASVESRMLGDGDLIRIDDGVESVSDGVLFVCTSSLSPTRWQFYQLEQKAKMIIGRDSSCDIVIPHVSTARRHAKITFGSDGYSIEPCGKSCPVVVNGKRISKKVHLHEKDVISLTSARLIYSNHVISWYCYQNGVSIDTSDIVIRRGHGRKTFVTSNHVSFSVHPGELVAIVGGSGAGKSTILNCMCGYLKPDEGNVFINGTNLYENFDALKKMIGYVPQSDIVYDNLSLYDMLKYTAKLRLPSDTSHKEREAAVDKAIATVELAEKKKSLIRSLSGGQRKRASIAVELLCDPNLLFLDEPCSGLDPGTERSLMLSLRKMADNGKTVVLVTHSTLQLKLCDRIAFMGKGGNLCFFGSYDEAIRYFQVTDIADIYQRITEYAEYYAQNFSALQKRNSINTRTVSVTYRPKEQPLRQLRILSMRYLRLIINDTQRLLLLLLQAPLLAFLISLVADGNQFEQYEMTKSLLFALSCSAFWVGMLNAIQEICKERTILKREFMTGLSLSAYVISKIVVLGILCLLQSFFITAVFAAMVGMPENGILFNGFAEVYITTFLTSLSASAMGLFVSSLFTNADRAMTVAPILLMPQILFSGLIFKLSGVTELISWLAVCRWSMESYGTTANLNDMPLRLQQQGVMIPHATESFFTFSIPHLLTSWGILILFVVLFLIAAKLVLRRIRNERG